jgi:hypothetical protein
MSGAVVARLSSFVIIIRMYQYTFYGCDDDDAYDSMSLACTIHDARNRLQYYSTSIVTVKCKDMLNLINMLENHQDLSTIDYEMY